MHFLLQLLHRFLFINPCCGNWQRRAGPHGFKWSPAGIWQAVNRRTRSGSPLTANQRKPEAEISRLIVGDGIDTPSPWKTCTWRAVHFLPTNQALLLQQPYLFFQPFVHRGTKLPNKSLAPTKIGHQVQYMGSKHPEILSPAATITFAASAASSRRPIRPSEQ